MLYLSQPIGFGSSHPVASWALCRLDSDWRHEESLTESEALDYAKLTSASRKREWLSARIALKQVLMHANYIDSPRHCQVDKNRFGCPRVTVKRGRDCRIMNCSISHKDGLAAVCISWFRETKVGIDVETLSEKPFRLRSVFAREDDRIIGMRESPEYYAVLWACKEAASKAKGLGMLTDFKTMCVSGNRDGRFSVFEGGKETIDGEYILLENLVVAISHQRLTIPGETKAA